MQWCLSVGGWVECGGGQIGEDGVGCSQLCKIVHYNGVDKNSALQWCGRSHFYNHHCQFSS